MGYRLTPEQQEALRQEELAKAKEADREKHEVDVLDQFVGFLSIQPGTLKVGDKHDVTELHAKVAEFFEARAAAEHVAEPVDPEVDEDDELDDTSQEHVDKTDEKESA